MVFHCELCSYKANSKHYIKEHVQVVHEGLVIRCKICPSTFTSASNIGQHMKYSHSTEQHPCPECKYVTNTKRKLKVHYGIWHGEKSFACEYCEYTAGYQHRINKHMKKAHKYGNLKCSNCDFETYSLQSLNEHTKSNHVNHLCSLCEFETANYSSLRDHIQSNHASSIFSCKECKFTCNINNKGSIESHNEFNHEEFQCKYCTKLMKFKPFSRHISSIHKVQHGPNTKNKERCHACNIVPRTEKRYLFHKYWKHSKHAEEGINHSKTNKKFDSHARKKSISDHIIDKNIISSKNGAKEIIPSVLDNYEFDDEDTKQTQNYVIEYFENEDKNIKEEDIDFEKQKEAKVWIPKNIAAKISFVEEKKIKTDFKYLCPIGHCTFSIFEDDKTIMKNHFMGVHSEHYGEISNIKFMKL